MKRGIFGCLMLLVLLLWGFRQMGQVRQELTPIIGNMELASQTILQEDYKKTAALTDGARAAWEDYRLKYSCLSSQQQVRRIDSLYDEVRVFLVAGETIHCSAACAELKNQLLALREDQSLSLPNLF